MTYAAKVIADSIAQGVRLTTMEITFPRFILAEFNTHRQLSKNSASSRAIPVEKRVRAVWDAPFVFAAFGKNQKGMQAGASLGGWQAWLARMLWILASKFAVLIAWLFSKIEVHKQIANRVLEPFAWHTVIVTGTEWENFYALRRSSLAQPEICTIAEMMEEAQLASTPRQLKAGEWHLPYVFDEDRAMFAPANLVRLSAARCARVSYLTHDGRRDTRADFALAESLAQNRHMSPFEHPAFVDDTLQSDAFAGNFRAPWRQLRKTMAGEAVAPREKR